MFQLTRPRGARRQPTRNTMTNETVSTHAPARGATRDPGQYPPGLQVSTHAPARGATYCVCIVPGLRLVSTHAPARGATKRAENGTIYPAFQLTRPRGARPARRLLWRRAERFQLTRPRGARLLEKRPDGRLRWVSTHAPARGATSKPLTTQPAQSCFNSRAREGRDYHLNDLSSASTRFNSRAREGRDHATRQRARLRSCFNSRAREGRDHVDPPARPHHRRFNSRAREGRDGGLILWLRRVSRFNSRAREGRDATR